MKRKLLPILAILLVVVLAGCAALTKDGSKTEIDPLRAQERAQAGQIQSTAEKTTKTTDQVKQIAFDHAKVTEADVKDLEVELENDASVLHFDVSFNAGEYEYDYEIDAYSGKILHSEKERDSDNKQTSTTSTTATTTTTTETKKTVAQVKKVALDHAGVQESAARDLEVELDDENGKELYEISFESGSYEYEYEIDAYTGKILKSEKEKDD